MSMTDNEIKAEVDYQVAEYDIDVNTAAENVADQLGRKWNDVIDAYYRSH